MNFELETPIHWEVKKLKEICSVVTDGTHKTPKYTEDGVPFISIANIQPYSPISFKKYQKYISQEEHEILCKRAKAEKDDILFPRIGTLGYAKRVDWEYEVSIFVGLGLAKPHKHIILPKFLEYYMNTQWVNNYSRSFANGSGRLTLPLDASRMMPVPLPTLSEQQEIVAKIEELFSELDKGKEQLETAKQQLKVYRQAVLKWAFEGMFTNSDVKDDELPEGWKLVKMGEVIEKPKYGTSKKCDYNIDGKAVIRIPNIGKGILDTDDLKFAAFDTVEIENYSLKEGDLLTIRSNGSVDLVGKCALITNRDEEFLYAGYLIRLRPIKEKVNSKFLLLSLSSSQLRSQIESKAKSTSGVNNINTDELKGLILSLPSLDEQLQIVQEIESRLSVCDKVEETITKGIQQAETLRQSILKQAFEGKLL